MERELKKRGGDPSCPKLLDFMISKEEGDCEGGGGFGVREEKKLELKLGPPGGDDGPSVLSLGYFPKASKATKRVFLDTVEPKDDEGLERRSCCPPLVNNPNSSQARSCCPPLVNNPNSSQARISSVPVVGWPPIRSFRRNLASSSSKPPAVPKNGGAATKTEMCKKSLFVKINMEGIPIGRKVDLKACDSYEKLSSVVEELFQGLLAAQRDPGTGGAQVIDEQKQAFTGLLDGTGEYTLVYEDNEGDRILVGDVPWEMFVSTAKRLRVLKSSDLATQASGAVSRKRTATGC